MQHNLPTSEHTASIRQGLLFVAGMQQPDGSFALAAAGAGRPPVAASLTLQAYILDLLHAFTAGPAADCARKLAIHIAQQLAQTDFTQTDTHALFAALAALEYYSPEYITPAVLARATTFLLQHETQPGGPYRSVQSNHTSQPAVAPNVTISRFLHYLGGPFPRLTAYIAQQYAGNSTRSPYYTTSWPLQWQLQHTAMPDTGSFLPKSGSIFTDVPPANLLSKQQPDGSWPTTYFYKDARGKQYGTPVVDTLLALNRLQSKILRVRRPKTTQLPNTFRPARQLVKSLDTQLKPTVYHTLRKLRAADHQHEIGLFAARFAPALRTGQPPLKTARALDIANIYNWAAYTLYDQILDTQNAARVLPAANVCLRIAVAQFLSAVPGTDFADLVQQTYNTIDAANAWELQNCRVRVTGQFIHLPAVLPDYAGLENLHNRSLSHSLPVLGTLMASGHSLQSRETQSIYAALKQYLVIRQLSDDLHDWQEDLQAGQLSYVVTCMLTDSMMVPGTYDLTELIKQLEKTFWNRTLPGIARQMFERADAARRLLTQSATLIPHNVIAELITGITNTMQTTLQEQRRAQAFLQAYKTV